MGELKEEDFIAERVSEDPYPLVWFLVAVLAFAGLYWSIQQWQHSYWRSRVEDSPFMQVTNRQISPFLWQHPEFMRVNRRSKKAYLPGFDRMGGIAVIPDRADEWVHVPAEVLFRYHTWQRLLSGVYFEREIKVTEFREFLGTCQQWTEEYWAEAPEAYRTLLRSLEARSGDEDLSTLAGTVLPDLIRLEFQGWKNYTYEGEAINEMQVSAGILRSFLQRHPEYRRSLWRNLYLDSHLGYLASALNNALPDDAVVPSNDMPPFLKVALFNSRVGE